MKFERYPKYKDSGIEWIGEIPEHWDIERIKYIFQEKRKIANPNLAPGSISFGKVVYKDNDKIPFATKQSYQVVEKGEFLINPLNLNYDLKSLRIALSNIDVVVSPGYIVLQVKSHVNVNVSKKYLNYLLHIFDILYMKILGVGIRQTISYSDLANCFLLLPPIDEQIKIADFLDEKTAQIDKAITLKKQLIERLKERRQILINDAVTKGLDKTVKMKDSGVEWIGEIPEHWEVRKLKFCLTLKNDKVDIQNENVIALENIEGWTGKALQSGSEYVGEGVRFEKGDILFGKLRPYLAKVFKAENNGVAFGDILVFTPKTEMSVSYSFYLMISKNFISITNSSTYGTKMPRVSPEYVKSLEIPFPSKKEQIQIANFLDEKTAQVDKAIELQQRQIEKLKEYKATLIDSVVTGKVKV